MGDVSDEQQHDAPGGHDHDADALTARSRASLTTKRTLFAALLLLTMIVTAVLGLWQVERRGWKLALIAAVNARLHAAPVAAPGPAEWSRLNAADAAYRRVRATGAFLHRHETLVHAVTGRGEGYWLLTPLRTGGGWIVLVNRGFVPAGEARTNRAQGTITITGLLRMSEPKGIFLRANDPAADRWYSRDVEAIARARHLQDVAPYFIDADRSSGGAEYPVGGLTVVSFRNAHLSYAITWFTLAGLSAWGLWFVIRKG